jgi:dTDP-glucose pyrophosphorylase
MYIPGNASVSLKRRALIEQRYKGDCLGRRPWHAPVSSYTHGLQTVAAVYDKPMIYYRSDAHASGRSRYSVISTPPYSAIRELLGDGSQWGLSLSYAVQSKPRGLARAFVVGRKFIGNDACVMILGDNIFFGSDLSD